MGYAYCYVYDAEGNRMAKGPITTWSCDPSTNGLEASAQETDYIINQSGQQVTEMTQDGSTMEWQHTNVWIGGQVLATYQTSTTSSGQPSSDLHFYLNDWLGTRRVMTDYAGVVEQQCASLPYGDYESCASTPTEQLFTGKQRDPESGNDYFGARYYASTTGRFLSPDWASDPTAVPYATYTDPQSLNLYNYMRDNPLDGTDPDGHWIDLQRAENAIIKDAHSPYAEGGAEVLLGGGLVLTAAFGDAPGGAVGGLLLYNAAQGGVVTGMMGATKILGAVTHSNVKSAERVLSATRNGPGLLTAAAGGNLKRADAVATVAGAASLATNPKEAVKNPATAAEAFNTGKEIAKSMLSGAKRIERFLSPVPPPPPTPPGAQGCSVAGACDGTH